MKTKTFDLTWKKAWNHYIYLWCVQLFYFFSFCILARRRTQRRTARSFTVNKNHIWWWMIILGILYFFSRMMAQGSPIFNFFTKYSTIAFGEIWLLFFFVLAIVVGVLVLVKWHLAKFLVKYYFALLMLISAFLNFTNAY